MFPSRFGRGGCNHPAMSVDPAMMIPVQALVLRIGLGEAALSGLVFLPGDLIKVVVTTLIVGTLVRGYPRAFRRQWRAPAAAVA